jgi:predicted lysophospholipase L1 biosynthesis ABC-type transport system permease subunit
MQTAAPEFFRAMGTRIIRGRAFADADRVGAPPVMLVSASMAAALWPGRDALGQCLRVSADTMPCATVVGVTEDIRQTGLRNDAEGQYYLPIEQHPSANPVVFVRVDGDATRYVETVRRRLQRLMPGASYLTVTPMHDIVAPAMRSWQLGATMFVALGVLALVLAVVGLYSVIAYGVVQRTRELGVRRALGAPLRHVLWLVLRDGVQFTVLGLALGGAIAVGAGRWIAPLLFGERPTDPWVYGAVTTVLFLAAMGASILPALRAARVAPSVALRAD